MAATLAAAGACFAQDDDPFGGGRGGGPTFSRQVILEGNSTLTGEFISLVCSTISDRYPRQDDADQSIRLRSVGLTWAGANVGDLVSIYRGDTRIGRRREGANEGDLVSVFNLSIGYAVDEDHEWKDADDGRLMELWEQARKELEQALRAMQQTAVEGRQARLNERQQRLEVQRHNATVELSEALNRLEELGAGDFGSQQQLEQQLADSVTMLRRLSLDRVSLTARRAAIEERVDQLREAAGADLETDPVVEQLEKIVQIREEQLAATRTLHEVGQTVATELKAVEYELAQARIELFKAKRAAIEQAHGAILRELNDELSKLFVDDAEHKARIEALAEIVAELRERTSVEVRVETATLEMQVNSLRERLSHVESELADLDDVEDVEEISLRPLEEALAPEEEADE
jgi:chromosome segregation ATPase